MNRIGNINVQNFENVCYVSPNFVLVLKYEAYPVMKVSSLLRSQRNFRGEYLSCAFYHLTCIILFLSQFSIYSMMVFDI